jgi:hypothetical protein
MARPVIFLVCPQQLDHELRGAKMLISFNYLAPLHSSGASLTEAYGKDIDIY